MLVSKNKKFNFKNFILIVIIIICTIILGVFIWDKFGDKTKVFKKALSLTDDKINEVLKIYDNVPNVDLSKDFNYKVSMNKDNNELVSTNFSGNDENNLYQLNLLNKVSSDSINIFIQDEKLYFKSSAFSNEIYALLFDDESECQTMVCSENVGKEIVESLKKYRFDNFNLDNILKDIGGSLNNKYITKERLIDVINEKKHLYSKYTYDMNEDAINDLKGKLKDNSNYADYLVEFGNDLFTNDTYKIDIYTYFGKTKKITINSLNTTIDILINDDISINYISDNKKSIIKFKENYLNFEYYQNDKKVSELTLIDSSVVNIKKYNGDDETYYSIKFTKNINDNGEDGSISINYLDNIYSINYSNENISSISKIDVSDARNYKEMSKDEQDKINNIFIELQNNDVIKVIIEILSLFSS